MGSKDPASGSEKKKKEKVRSRDLKKRGRAVLKTHYRILIVACLLGSLMGTMFSDSITNLKSLISTGSPVPPLLEEGEVKEEPLLSTGLLSLNQSASYVVTACLEDGLNAGSTVSGAIRDYQVENADNPSFGRTRGVMASLVNSVSSGALWVTWISAVRNIAHSDQAATVIAIVFAMLLDLLLVIFVREVYAAAMARTALECRTYGHVPYTRILYVQKVKRWFRTTLTFALTDILTILWSLTIVGGFIKYFSYFLVPWIVAENPDIRPREAITLSRRMMKGHKWDLFVKMMTFVGWYLLDMITFGLSGIFYSNAYTLSTYTEYYAWVRGLAKAQGIEGTELLNDHLLYEKAPQEALDKAYAKEKKALALPPAEMPKRNKGLTILAEWFGLIIRRSPEERAYEQALEAENQKREAGVILAGDAYPDRLSAFGNDQRSLKFEGFNYNRAYTVVIMCFLFLLFSFVGWIWEGSLHAIEEGNFVNRGVLHGPWIPIYGTGCVLVLLLLKKLRRMPIAHFFATVLLCGTVEYLTGLVLELTHDGQRWWDYSGYFMNIQGRVCLEGLLVFGIVGSLVVYVLAPIVDSIVARIPAGAFVPVVLVLMGIYLVDDVYSASHPNMGAGITDISRAMPAPGIFGTETPPPGQRA